MPNTEADMTQTFTERCKLATDCLPDADYRARLEALHGEMLLHLEQKEAMHAITQDQLDLFAKQNEILEGKVICCGVAASHSDATLTTRGAYAEIWNSPQAEEVRKLRRERDELLAYIANHLSIEKTN